MSNADASTSTRLGGLVNLLTRDSSRDTPKDRSEEANLLHHFQTHGRANRVSPQSMKLALSLRSKAGDRKVLLFAGLDAAYPSTALVRSIGHALIEAAEQPVLLVIPDFNNPWPIGEAVREDIRGRNSTLGSMPADFPIREIKSGLFEMRVPTGSRGIRTSPGSEFDELLRRLRENFRFILVAAPSDGSETDRTLLALLSDGMVIVVERGRQSLSRLQDIQRQLASNLIPVLGYILAENHARD